MFVKCKIIFEEHWSSAI